MSAKFEYNFNVEDIEKIEICNMASDNQFSMIYTRIENSLKFINTFDAIDTSSDIDMNNMVGTLEFVCTRCGDLNKIPNIQFIQDKDTDAVYPGSKVSYECKYCSDDYSIIVEEDSVIDILMASFPEDGVEIYINDEKIK